MLNEINNQDINCLTELIAESVRTCVPISQENGEILIKEIIESLQNWYHSGAAGFHRTYSVDGEIAGFIVIKNYWNLTHLFVLPDFQHRGIGRALLNAAIEDCRNKSPQKKIKLNSSKNAADFYKALGFQQTAPDRNRPGGCIPFEYPFS